MSQIIIVFFKSRTFCFQQRESGAKAPAPQEILAFFTPSGFHFQLNFLKVILNR